MNVLFVASECTPLVKVGGLGDVIGSLPKALAKIGVNITVAIPGYQTIDLSKWTPKLEFVIHFDGQPLKVNLFETTLPGSTVPLLAFREDKYIASGGVYFSKTAFSSSQDEINRFTVFDMAVAHWISQNKEGFDIIHAHDWHTGILSHFLTDEKSKAKKIFTIHNLANQGMSALEIDAKIGGHINHDKLLSWDSLDHSLDLMLQGIGGSDWITTVSPSYSKEILTPAFGEKLEEILRSREGRITGILNGLDYDFWNPSTDQYLKTNYNSENYKNSREQNRQELRRITGLKEETKLPLFGFIGRLTTQKGLDLILNSLNTITNIGQLVVLGQGAQDIEDSLKSAAAKSSGTMVYVETETNFHEDYEHLMYGACDFFLVPSRFEPCGLVQMIAMHYGAIPIAHAVGGLKDTIDDGKTGYLFQDYSSEDLNVAIGRATKAYQNQDLINQLVIAGMAKDFSWDVSAKEYLSLYQKVLSIS